MDTPSKLRANLSTGEFEAEGSSEWVAEQFERFTAAAKTARPPQRTDSPPGKSPPPVVLHGPVGLDDAIMDRAFEVDQERDIVSLRVLPKSANRDADAILLTLYGFRVLQGKLDVPVMKLTAALTQSGASVDRIDRSLGPHANKITKGGRKTGGKYGLKKTGVVEADKILSTLFT